MSDEGTIITNALLTGSVNIARRCATKPRKAQRNEKQALMPLQVVLWNCMRPTCGSDKYVECQPSLDPDHNICFCSETGLIFDNSTSPGRCKGNQTAQ